MDKTSFEETQRFTQWWLWLIILGLFGTMLYKFIQKENLQENLAPIIILLLVILLFALLNLKTRIDQKGIHVKMFPFHFKFVTYKWEEIQSVKVRKYSPITEYGGWGVRIGPNGKAFNVKGNKGIEIITANGDNRMIGTQKMEEVSEVLKNFKE